MNLVSATFHIDGMTCQGCAASVTRALEATPGVINVAVSLDDKYAIVQYDDAQTTSSTLIAVIENAGFDVRMSETS
ncbi:MAG: heavy-metal-associated domain-containing protein [Burkholderiales bacterium]|nr:heavy-metal-associated domain-containing protein [Burkholderiales bacterium]